MKRLFAVLLCLVLTVSILPHQSSAVSIIEEVTLSLAYPEAGKDPAEAAWYGTGYSVYATEWYDWDEYRYLEPGDKIQVGHQYEATIWVEADIGYEFQSVNDYTPAITAIINGEPVEVTKAYEYKAWAMVTLTYYFESVPEKGWITSVDLTIPAPETGAKPFYDKIETDTYWLGNVYFSSFTDPKMKNGISWYNEIDGEQLDPTTGEVFAPQTPYTFHCLIFPEDGYRITRDARVRVNGQPARARLDYATFLAVFYTFPATAPVQTEPEPHVHTPGGLRYNSGGHYRYCTGCGEIVELEEHTGGKATCVEKGKCTVCGYAYLPENEDHTPDTEWTACAGLYHAKLCTRCGAHCTPEAHQPGAEATEISPQTCTVCGYIMAPAKEHTHKLSKVEMIPATCTKEGQKEHYTCSGCSDLFSDAEGKNKISNSKNLVLPALNHEYSGLWEYSETEHWMVCNNCSEPFTETRMAHDLQNGVCQLCGYKDETGTDDPPATDPSEPENPTKPEEPENPTKPKDPENPTKPDTSTQQPPKKDSSWLVLVLIGLVSFVVAIVATVLVLKRKK